MKIEDIKFPIEVKEKDKLCEYNIEFRGDTFFKKCCSSKSITGTIESRNTPKLIKGFKLKTGDAGFEWLGCFRFCPRCGELKSDYSEVESVKDVILEAWLKTINNKRTGSPAPSRIERWYNK